MKALTLLQPWAVLVAEGLKRLETRKWRTSYRGPLAIHSSARIAPVRDWPGEREGGASVAARTAWRHLVGIGERPRYSDDLSGMRVLDVEPLVDPEDVRPFLVTRHVLAVVDLVEVLEIGRMLDGTVALDGVTFSERVPCNPLFELAFGDFAPGRYAWRLANLRRLERPVEARGSLGLWDWKEATAGL